MSMMMAKMSSRGQTAYTEAGDVVEQTLGAIRTVSHKLYLINFAFIFKHIHLTTYLYLTRLPLLLVRKKQLKSTITS